MPFKAWPGTRVFGQSIAPELGAEHLLQHYDLERCAERCANSGGRCVAFSWAETEGGCQIFGTVEQSLPVPGYNSWIHVDNSLLPGRETFEEDRLSQIDRDTIHSILSERYSAPNPTAGFGIQTRALIERFQKDIGAQNINGFLTRSQIKTIGRGREFERHRETLLKVVDNPFLEKSGCHLVSDAIENLVIDYFPFKWPDQAKAGDGIFFSGLLPPSPDRLPAFMVVAFSKPVRVKSSFGYVLQPEARFAFDIETAKDQQRFVVPLFTKDTPKIFDFVVTPILAQDVSIETFVVAPSACGPSVKANAAHRIHVDPGAPNLLVHEEVTGRTPSEVLQNTDGSRFIEIYDSSFVLRSAEGIILLEHDGSNVDFSPTTRFATSYLNQGIYIWDVLDGHLLEVGRAQSLGWENADSFAHYMTGSFGETLIFNTGLQADSLLRYTASLCRVCNASEERIFFSLEDDALWADFQRDGSVSSISSRKSLSNYDGLTFALRSHSNILPASATRGEVYKDYVDVTYEASALTQSRFEIEKAFWADRFGSLDFEAKDESFFAIARRGFPSEKVSLEEDRLLQRLEETFGVRTLVPQEFGDLEAGGIYTFEERGARVAAEVQALDPSLDTKLLADCDPGVEPPKKGEIRTLCADKLDLWRLRFEGETYTLISGWEIFGTAGTQFFTHALHRSDRPGQVTIHRGTVPYDATEPWPCQNGCGFQAHLLDGRYIVSFSAGVEHLDFFDLDTGIMHTLPAFRGTQTSLVRLTKDRKHLLQVNKDGHFALHRVPKSEREDSRAPVLFGVYRDDEILVWNEDLAFGSSHEGAHLMHIHFNGLDRVFPFESFRSQLEHKNLVAQTLAGQSIDTNPNLYPPTSLQLEIVEENDVEVTVSLAHSSGAAPERFFVYQDGQLDRIVTAAVLPSIYKFAKRPGARSLSVLGVDAQSQTGLVSTVAIRERRGQKSAYVIALGVDRFEDPLLPRLNGPREDAALFTQELMLHAQDNHGLKIASLREFGQSANPQAYLRALREAVEKAGEDDLIVLQIGSHGIEADDGSVFVAMPKTDVGDLTGTSLNWNEVQEFLASARAKVIVFLDVCHSGLAGTDLFSPADKFVSSVLDGSDTTLLVVAASKGREFAYEGVNGSAGGAFSNALTRILFQEIPTFDYNSNGRIDVSELYIALRREVARSTGGRQNPWIARNRLIGDFPVF